MKLDTEHNLLSVILMAGIAFLVLLGLVSFLLLGRVNVESIAPTGSPESALNRRVAQSPELAELSEYATIIERPVFFADRRLPVMELAGADDEPVDDEPEPVPDVEIPELGASVAGIIITPELKLAMITDNASNKTLVLREGMAMAGEKSAWRIAQIRSRGVQFETDGGRTEDLELTVETSALQTGAQPRRQAAVNDQQQDQDAAAGQGNGDDAEAQARARAEEIRQRVAERRAQLRAEAERRAREQNDGG